MPAETNRAGHGVSNRAQLEQESANGRVQRAILLTLLEECNPDTHRAGHGVSNESRPAREERRLPSGRSNGKDLLALFEKCNPDGVSNGAQR